MLSDEQWARVEPLLPSSAGRQSRPFRNHRQVAEGIIYRYRTGMPWRDLPRDHYGLWQTVWKRHHRFSTDGIWDKVVTVLPSNAPHSFGVAQAGAPTGEITSRSTSAIILATV